MDMLENMNDALAHIEANLAEDVDYREVARLAACSEHHFRRMFSSLAGIPLTEYIRRRKLTLAAFELKDVGLKVIDVALKYGYSSPDAFARAFQNMHGIAPSEVKRRPHSLKAYPRMTFQLTIKGGMEMNYTIEEKQAFKIVGIKKQLTVNEDGSSATFDELWESIDEESIKQIEAFSNSEPAGLLHVTVDNPAGKDAIDYYMAAATTKETPDNLAELYIPASSWAVFHVDGEWEQIQDTWERIYSEWFPTSSYEHAGSPEILQSSDDSSEILIPVVKKKP